jgi:hypothetical protein
LIGLRLGFLSNVKFIVGVLLGNAGSDWDKTREVESGKFKVEKERPSLTHFPLVIFLWSFFSGFCSRTRKSHFMATPIVGPVFPKTVLMWYDLEEWLR